MTAGMKDTAQQVAAADAAPETQPKKKKDESFTLFLLKLVLVVAIFRSFIFSPFNIPSESMLPSLWDGDYLLAAKWPYGYTSDSLPFGIPLIPGRILASQPERGDMVIFKHPIDGTDYIKRVIALPGDTVQMVNGAVHLNGEPVRNERVEDFIIPVSPNTTCAEPRFAEADADGELVCRYPQYREVLPNGVSYNVLDFGLRPQDVTAPILVPEGEMFLMGDNRDNSLDSRFPAEAQRGIGLVPQDRLIGEATFMMWSTDGSAQWYNPISWLTSARWGRIGRGI